MTAATQQDELTQVGPGSVMGNLMRQYWIPAAKTDEISSDGPPMRLMLLGEKLVAFRDSSGRVGIMDHRCPHRCASLFLGRNEEDGLRCIYHGWKFDVDGNCVDMPSVPPEQDFKEKVRARAYPVLERHGVIWVYMGSREQPPPLPRIEAAMLPHDQLDVTFIQRDCNFLQALEGDIDTSHVGFLHFGSLDPDNIPDGHPLQHTTTRAPAYHVRDTPWGTAYSSYRKADNGADPVDRAERIYWRCSNFMFPFWTQTPQGEFSTNINARAWVPIDDRHTMFVYFRWTKRPGYNVPLKDGKLLPGSEAPLKFRPRTTNWLGRYRIEPNRDNDWMIDREAQHANVIYSGIQNIHIQDQAITESMGNITDHSWEHLGPGDRMVARTRRRLLQAARALLADGTSPPGVDDPEVFWKARSGYFLTASDIDWINAYDDQVGRAVRAVQSDDLPANR